MELKELYQEIILDHAKNPRNKGKCENYNRDALDSYRHGDLDKALYWSNLSLRTSTVQPEMIRLRERITNEKESLWERDLLRGLMFKEKQAIQSSVEDMQ